MMWSRSTIKTANNDYLRVKCFVSSRQLTWPSSSASGRITHPSLVIGGITASVLPG